MDDKYTPEQRRNIELLRNRMTGFMPQDQYEDDSLFLRFLIARDYDLKAAEAMLKNNMKWRKANKIDTLLEYYTPPEVATKYIPGDHLGWTKEGLPVLFCRFGNADFKGIYKSLKKNEVCTYMAYYLEWSLAQEEKRFKETGKKSEQFCFIFDLTNFTLASATYKPALDIMILLISVFESHYPERMKTTYILNASFYFTLFWSVVSPFLAGATFKKVKLYGKEGYIDDLLNDIDAEILPAFLGGTLTDPDGDPMCRTLIRHGGPVDPKYFSVRDDVFRKKCSTKKLFIHRMSKERLEINVDKPGSILEWEFEVKSRDIGFSVLFRDAADIYVIPKEVVPHQRIETVISSETGMLRCTKAGIYILEFDNSYSWMHSKEVYYATSVLQSDQLGNDL